MSRVICTFEETTLTNDNGRDVASVRATCEECGHVTRSFGTGDGSRRRCLLLMRKQCPQDEENFYVDEDEA